MNVQFNISKYKLHLCSCKWEVIWWGTRRFKKRTDISTSRELLSMQHSLTPAPSSPPCASLARTFTLCSGFKFPNQNLCWIFNFQTSPCQQEERKKKFFWRILIFPDCIPGLIPYSLLLLSISSLDNFQLFRFTAIPSKVFHPQINATILFLKARGKYIESTQMFGKYIKARLVGTKTLPKTLDVLSALTIQSNFKYEQKGIPNWYIPSQ